MYQKFIIRCTRIYGEMSKKKDSIFRKLCQPVLVALILSYIIITVSIATIPHYLL